MCSGRKASRTRPPPGRRSGRPPDSTSSSLGMPSRACTSRARTTDRMTTADGATRRTLVVLRKRETTYSSTVPGGKTSRPSCGRGSKRQPRGRSGSGVSATSWRTRGAARRWSTSCGVPTMDERLPRWRRAGIARTRRRKWWRRARRRGGGGACGVDPRASGVFFFFFFVLSLVCLTCCVAVHVFCLVVVLACDLFPFVLRVFTVWRKGGRGCCH